ncbi:LysR substrate-binding domain-containing protein [Rhodococcus sp. OK302]|uniref:LysR substrate-binding domain-containing protein n=1 Tax=Rhodococcus sp. OK302 TaxID=1882769 RepID=UPI000B93AD0B|nr:LysR substrate-binding domain-containing protein [Rhodococcus sp. OK302]OYD71288.1 DNA-binding transcriptional LysR family regulator [Rhodococcus sp. OK302]
MPRVDPAPTYTIRQLAAFVAVAETGTISAAAERMHLSPSAMSASITELERALKVQLCVRRRAFGVQLTPTGEFVLLRARALLKQAGELESDALGTSGTISGPIAIGCYPALGPTVLPSMIAGFTREYPATAVEFREDTQNRLQAQLENGELDLAIVYDLDLSTELRMLPLSTREPLIVLGAEHPLAASDRQIHLPELAEFPMVLLDAPPSTKHALDVCRAGGFVPDVAYRTANFETARAFVGRGLGWTLLLQRPSLDVTYEGLEVVVKTIGSPVVPSVNVVLAWHQDARLSRVARAFIEFVSQSGRMD